MPAKLKHSISRLAERAGYTIVPTWRLELYPQAAFLRRFLRHLEIDCVFDVGANVGQYRDFLRRQVGYEGTIVSFEPIPENVAILRQRAREDGRWLIEGYALGRAAGSATFNVMASSEFSSFLEPDDSITDRFHGANEVARRVEVEIRTLAHALPEIERRLDARAVYLKLDTQGYDVDVGQGAGAAIERVRGLQMEASVQGIYAGAPDFGASIRAFNDLGFELSAIFPNNPDHFPVLYEFDCHMIARKYSGLRGTR